MKEYRALSIPEIGAGASIERAADIAEGNDRFDLAGAEGGCLAPFLVRLAQKRECRTLVVTPDLSGARDLARDLDYHLQAACGPQAAGAVLDFPAYDFSPYDDLAPDRLMAMRRTGALFHLAFGTEWRFLVIPADALARKLIPREAFEAGSLPVAPGEEIDREVLVGFLERGGYHRSAVVEEPGTYAVRGSLVDFYPPYLTLPVRVDLFGSMVENIRFFDPETQAGKGEAREVWVHPVRLALIPQEPDERRAAAAAIRAACDAVNQPTRQTEQTIEDLFRGRLLVGADRFAPAFHGQLGSLTDYLPESASICLVNPARIALAFEKVAAAFAADFERRIADRAPSFPPEAYALIGQEAERFFASRKRVLVHPLAVEAASEPQPLSGASPPVDLRAVATADLGERIRGLAADGKAVDLVGPLARLLQELEEAGYRTTIVAHTEGQAGRLLSMLRGRGLRIATSGAEFASGRPGLAVEVGELARGCVLPADGRCWIAEEELFGRRRRRSSAAFARAVSLGDLRQLAPGDLVVHAEHGLGRYEGLVRQRIRNAEMDFLHIVYRDGDRLYLPVYRLNQVQKYKGGEGQHRLDKLGGQTFARAKEEARGAARDMAGKLLDLYARRAASTRSPFDKEDDLYRTFEAAFPFDETDDQARAIDEVLADLALGRPMDRLVCGDVGFGKTEVAMRAAFRVVMAGRQVAILVPTTVLAQQHYQTVRTRFSSYPVRVAMLSRFQTAKENSDIVFALKEGTVDIVVGTHRLLSRDVHFRRLGLLIVDEEHRFGVSHKERIRALRASVDTLALTATPIPRTLQMAMGGVRDLSLIGTAPAARRSIKTVICHDDPKLLKEAIEREMARDGQVFFVHNRVRDIGRVAERVAGLVPEGRLAVAHGQMREEDLERVMLDFVAGRYDILVSTSIIESGLDIPRANTIIIDRADTFGMAQLYQLRGRVGRSHQQAYAYLLVPPLATLTEEARQRVETLARYSELGSGFSVASIDLEIRGSGNLLGQEQSGNLNAVGLEMFYDLLGEATAELRGEPRKLEIEPELTFENPGYIPEEYLPDVGQRLQYYKRPASAAGEEEVQAIAAEMVDRLGPIPEETEALLKVMVIKAVCRGLGIRGVESTARRLVVHLSPDSAVDPETVTRIVREERGAVKLTRDLKITVRFPEGGEGGADGAKRFLERLAGPAPGG